MATSGLSDEQEAKLKGFLDKKWSKATCYQCSANDWGITALIPLMVNDINEPGSLVIGGSRLPCAALTCRNCGHTVLVNLIVAGILPSKATAAADPAKGGDNA